VNETRLGEREWGTRAGCMRLKRPRCALTRSNTIVRVRAITSHDVHRGAITLVVEKLLTALERETPSVRGSLDSEQSRTEAAVAFRTFYKKLIRIFFIYEKDDFIEVSKNLSYSLNSTEWNLTLKNEN